MLSLFTRVWLCATQWTVAHQTPLSMGFFKKEHQSGLPCPSPGDLPDPGIKPGSPSLQVGSLSLSRWGSPMTTDKMKIIKYSDYSYICWETCESRIDGNLTSTQWEKKRWESVYHYLLRKMSLKMWLSNIFQQ